MVQGLWKKIGWTATAPVRKIPTSRAKDAREMGHPGNRADKT
jgi:hypothetical protein